MARKEVTHIFSRCVQERAPVQLTFGAPRSVPKSAETYLAFCVFLAYSISLFITPESLELETPLVFVLYIDQYR